MSQSKSRFDEDGSEQDLLLFHLAEQFVKQYRSGQVPDIDCFADAHPEQAEQIREELSGLVLAELLRDGASGQPDRVTLPERIGGYTLVRRIGAGGMGTVYEASHPRLSRKTAIKVLNSGKMEAGRHSAQLLKEADIASRLHHPHIVPVLDFAEDNGIPFISMLHIDGISLDQILYDHWEQNSAHGDRPRPGQDFTMIAGIGAQAASALSHAHAHGTIHRDIKPGNLILDRSGKTWVTDFGLATLAGKDSSTNTTAVAGTPRYIAPEQLSGTADERSDVYSLGVTLYELASGTKVHGDQSTQNLAGRRMASLPDIRSVNSRVPRPLADIIMVACSLRPEDRYPSAAELQTVLSRFAHSGVSGDRRQRLRSAPDAAVVRLSLLITAVIVCCICTITSALIGRNAWVDAGDRMQWFLSSAPMTLGSDRKSRSRVDQETRSTVSPAEISD